jgi:hypothetical protein
MSDDAAPEKPKVGGKKLGRPPGVKETKPRRPQQGFVPPDGPDERGMVRQPQGGAIQPRYGTNHPLHRPTTPAAADYKEGMNPTALKRYCFEKLRDITPDGIDAFTKLVKGGPGVDDRVHLMALQIWQNRMWGKEGDLPMYQGDEAGSRRIAVRFLTEDEQEELQAAIDTMTRLAGLAAERESKQIDG